MYAGALLSSRKRPGAVKALKPVTYVRPAVKLDAAEIAAYAKVCGFKPEAGVPVLYPQMLTFPLAMEFFASEYCPWPAMGTVHLANRVVQHARLHVGDVLRVEMRTGELLAHEKGQIFIRPTSADSTKPINLFVSTERSTSSLINCGGFAACRSASCRRT